MTRQLDATTIDRLSRAVADTMGIAIDERTDLGLSIAEWILQKHGGTLDWRPAPQAGTIATLRIQASVVVGVM